MGRATASRTAGRATRRADCCAIVPLDLRAGGPPTLILTRDGYRGPVPWSLPPESRSDHCTTGDRTRQTGAYIPEPTAQPVVRLGRTTRSDTRLDPLGPAAMGSGPGRSKGSDAGWSGRRAEPGRAGPINMHRYGEPALFTAMSHATVAVPHRSATTPCKGVRESAFADGPTHAAMDGPTHAAMDTSAAPMRPRANGGAWNAMLHRK